MLDCSALVKMILNVLASSVLSNPNWLRQMAVLPGSGFDGDFFLLKGSVMHAKDKRS